jgi:hypothetical protein
MKKSVAMLFGISIAVFVRPADAVEAWDCHYIHTSHKTGRGAPKPLNIHARYEVEDGNLVLLGGTARYHVNADTDFGLVAVRTDACSFCTDGPLLDTEVVAINKLSGSSSLVTIFVSKGAENDLTLDKGKCSKIG